MAFDVGDRRIGVAVSSSGIIADAVGYIQRDPNNQKKDIDTVREYINKYSATVIVVGLPKNMNGTLGPQGEKVLAFTKKIEEAIPGSNVVFWDERLTTVAATNTLIEGGVRRSDRKTKVDKVAAALILQSYLDYNSMRH
ncbi:MAG: Holliday junction resolvase RuvX [Clostridiales bacterium]|nr:Holliday junction resolvase RuvX [Clostridiales bacterium]